MKKKARTAADIMTRPVHTLRSSINVREAVAEFQDLGISGAPVVDEEGRLVGVLSQTDVMDYYLSRDEELVSGTDYYQRVHLGAVPWREGFKVMDTNTASVGELMSPTTITAAEDAPVRDLARLMVRSQIHRIIITRDDQVVGVVSALDLLRVLCV